MLSRTSLILGLFVGGAFLSACGGGSGATETKTVTATASANSSSATAAPASTTAPQATADGDDVNRVISSRGDVICLMFQTQGMNQKTLDEVAQYVLTTPAIKLSKQQSIQVIQGSVETYCPQFSQQIAEVFG
jgi:hypothetical protein